MHQSIQSIYDKRSNGLQKANGLKVTNINRKMTALRIFIVSLLVWLSLVCNTFGQTHYNFEIIARTGALLDGYGPITDLGAGPSINDAGKVAFIARDAGSGINGRVMVVSEGKLERNFLIPPTERIGTDVQINNLDQVVWWRRIEAPGSILNQDTLVQRLDTENSGEIIARGTITDWFDTIWDYVLPWATVNNNGLVFFTGDTDFNKVSEELRGTVLASRDGGSGPYQMTPPLSNFPIFFPMASDNNRVVIRGGNDVTDTLKVFVENTLDPTVALDVATAADFNIIGSKPGISDDGRVVVFMGHSKTEGPGVYMAAINEAGNFCVRFKVADISGSNPALPMRVGVNQSNFEPFDYKVVYLANTPSGLLGLFAVRVDVTNPFESEISEPPTLLVEVGSTIDGIEYLGKIKNIGLYDPVNNKGQIAFWVETDIGFKAIIRNCLDSDGDALCDSWETDGIKDADGNVIVNLPAMGADPDYKDIFVEVDYMGNLDVGGNDVGHSHKPKEEAIAIVVNAFLDAPADCKPDDPENCKGIRLHVDFGPNSVMNPVTGETWGANSRSESLTHINRFAPSCFTSPPSDGCSNELLRYVEDTVKDHFIRFNGEDELTRRESAFHYALFVHESNGRSGVSLKGPERWFVVSLASLDKCSEFTNDNGRGTVEQQAGTFMHELGHNLGLNDYGIDDGLPYKPNYLSVMNYLFQLNGLIINQNHPKHPGPSFPFALEGFFDFSRFDASQVAILKEEALDESIGLGAAADGYGTRYFCWPAQIDRPCGVVTKARSVADAKGPIDWNCKEPVDEENVSISINADDRFDDLKSFNDWKHLIFGGGRFIKSITMGAVAPIELILNELGPEEVVMIPRHYAVVVNSPMGLHLLPGESTTYDFHIRNIGEDSDTYTLHATSSQTWAEVGTFPQTVTLASGQESVVSVDITVPSEALGDDTDELKLKALSQVNPLLLDAGSVITEVEVLHLQKCEGDFDYDFDVDGSDLAVFAADFGRTNCAGDCDGDLDGDDDVDGSDLAVFAADFGRTDCPTSD